MAASSSMTRMRDFIGRRVGRPGDRRDQEKGWSRRVDPHGAQQSLVGFGLVEIDGEHVTGMRRSRETLVIRNGSYAVPIDLEEHVAALDVGVVRRAHGI